MVEWMFTAVMLFMYGLPGAKDIRLCSVLSSRITSGGLSY